MTNEILRDAQLDQVAGGVITEPTSPESEANEAYKQMYEQTTNLTTQPRLTETAYYPRTIS